MSKLFAWSKPAVHAPHSVSLHPASLFSLSNCLHRCILPNCLPCTPDCAFCSPRACFARTLHHSQAQGGRPRPHKRQQDGSGGAPERAGRRRGNLRPPQLGQTPPDVSALPAQPTCQTFTHTRTLEQLHDQTSPYVKFFAVLPSCGFVMLQARHQKLTHGTLPLQMLDGYTNRIRVSFSSSNLS